MQRLIDLDTSDRVVSVLVMTPLRRENMALENAIRDDQKDVLTLGNNSLRAQNATKHRTKVVGFT